MYWWFLIFLLLYVNEVVFKSILLKEKCTNLFKELIDDVKIKLGDEEKETFDHWVRIVEPDAQSITKEIIA